MLKNYFKTAWRNITKGKLHASINIIGLSIGMAVTILIGLWIYDEVSFDKNFDNYSSIGKLRQFVSFDKEKSSYDVMPIPLADELRTKYPEFKAVSLVVQRDFVVANGDKKFSEQGNYVQPDFTGMMSLQMINGTGNSLNDINAVLLSQSLSEKLFGNENAVDKIVKINNKLSVKITGVYKDMPGNSSFKDLDIIAPWNQFVANDENAKNDLNAWDNNSYNIYVQLKSGADFSKVSAKIKDIRMKKENPPGYKPEFFIHPMSKWHLCGEFKNGVNTGGLIEYVWLFGIIGTFVLLLACINFMNLSTARSEKRAKEVGIRKAIGSLRNQLVVQFFSESVLVAFIAFLISLLGVQLMLPFFNEVAAKKLSVLWFNPWFWIAGLAFSLITGLLAGSYPAIYLSSFKPVEVLKGVFKAGRFAAVPRRVLVVLQFTVSVILIIGTIIIFRQIEYSKNRPVGYARNGLIEINMNTPDLKGHYDALRNDLLNTGAVSNMSESSGSVTVQYGGTTDISWQTKKPDEHPLLMSNSITYNYGKTVGWQLSQGRDFSRDYADSSSVILNESALKLMGLKNPLNEFVKVHGKDYKVVGVIKDMVKESPFEPVNPSFFLLDANNVNVINIKLAPQLSASESLAKVESVFKKYNPASPFIYQFVDETYSKKFGDEERIGKLASFFAMLAILISCLGLFGMASFMAEQRTKEIGVRKVLGASVFNLWRLLSKEFVMLVIVSFCIAAPVAYYFMHNWLQNYTYRTNLSSWIFITAGIIALLITLLTVSFQAIKAAIANPVKSLRSE